MKFIKCDKFRKIILDYGQIRKTYKVPHKSSLTMGTTFDSSNPFRIYYYNEGITHWEIEYTRKDIESQLHLLPGESVIDFNFIAFDKYSFQIKTSAKDLNSLKNLDTLRLNKLSWFKRLFAFKFDVDRLYFNEVKRLMK